MHVSDLLVTLGQDWHKILTWGTPRSRKVEGDQLVRQLSCADLLTIFALDQILQPSKGIIRDFPSGMLFAADGAQIFPSVSSPTGTGGPFGPLEAAIDNNTDTFWAGDFDVDMGCDCFKDSSIDGHALVFDMGSVTSVMRIRLYQGYNAWSVSKIRIFCGDDAESFFLQPLSLDIPEDVADIQCTSSGCSVTDSQTPKLQCASMSSLPRILWSCCFVTYLLQLGS